MTIKQLVKFAGILILILAIMGGNVLFVAAEQAAPNTAYDVDTTGDASDSTPGDGFCNDGTNHCSLRAAIQEANAHAGKDTVTFSISEGTLPIPRVILIGSPGLPAVTESIVIDGSTQSNGAEIQLTGTSAGSVDGLTLKAGISLIKRITIDNFENSGIVITGTATVSITGNIIDSNGRNGIVITNSGNKIGGTSAAERNYIRNNGASDIGDGIYLAKYSQPVTNNRIQGNYIGVNNAGTAAAPNADSGIRLYDAFTNTIGGTNPGAGNVIAGSSSGYDTGITISDGGFNTIQGNKIGTDASGTAVIGLFNGIRIISSKNNVIGGADSGAHNLVSGCGKFAIQITSSGDSDTDDNQVIGNYIGTDITGLNALMNGTGVHVDKANGTIIGGTESGAGNLISANDIGIDLQDEAIDTLILNNRIGVKADGGPRSNFRFGIRLSGAGNMNNQVGGIAANEGNIIAYNGWHDEASGILIVNGAKNNPLRGNSILYNGYYATTAPYRLGIDLGGTGEDGVTPNDTLDPDTGSNNLQNYPILTSWSISAGGITLNGTLNSTASTTIDIDFYGNSVCDPSGYGEGEWYMGSKQVTTNGSGNATFSQSLKPALYFTATATDPSGNTSEFSNCLKGPEMVFLPVVLR
jgi:CSLREA domain-containing protein